MFNTKGITNKSLFNSQSGKFSKAYIKNLQTNLFSTQFLQSNALQVWDVNGLYLYTICSNNALLNDINLYLPGSSANDYLVSNNFLATLTNKTINCSNNTLSNISNTEIKSGAAIDALKISSGLISNTEFDYLNGLDQNLTTTSNVVFNQVSTPTLKANTIQDNGAGSININTYLSMAASNYYFTGFDTTNGLYFNNLSPTGTSDTLYLFSTLGKVDINAGNVLNLRGTNGITAHQDLTLSTGKMITTGDFRFSPGSTNYFQVDAPLSGALDNGIRIIPPTQTNYGMFLKGQTTAASTVNWNPIIDCYAYDNATGGQTSSTYINAYNSIDQTGITATGNMTFNSALKAGTGGSSSVFAN